MRVVIAGGHGKIALLLEAELVRRGHNAVGLVRREEQLADLTEVGAEGVLLDLENDGPVEFAKAVRGADAVVFAAGGGTDGDATRKETVDKNAAIKLADAAQAEGVRRYLMVSAMGTDAADPESDEVFDVYLRAKQAADDDLRGRDLDWTVVKPGRLTDDDATGRVAVGDLSRGEVTRTDVATVLAEALTQEHTFGKTFDLLGGDQSVAEALASL